MGFLANMVAFTEESEGRTLAIDRTYFEMYQIVAICALHRMHTFTQIAAYSFRLLGIKQCLFQNLDYICFGGLAY